MEPKTFRLSWRDGVYRVSDPTLPDECTCLRIEDHDAEIAAINAKLAAAEARIGRLQCEVMAWRAAWDGDAIGCDDIDHALVTAAGNAWRVCDANNDTPTTAEGASDGA